MGVIRDFTEKSIEEIRGIIKEEERGWFNLADFVEDEWMIDELDVNDYLDNMKTFQSEMIDKYDVADERLDEILENVETVDTTYSAKMKNISERMKELYDKIAATATSLIFPKAIVNMATGEYIPSANKIDTRYNDLKEKLKEHEVLFVNLIDTTLITIINSKHRHFSHISQ